MRPMPQQDWPELKNAPSTRFSTACVEVRIRTHVGRIVAAELQADADEALGRRALNRVTALDRARERDEVDARVADHPLGVRVRQVQNLEHAGGQTGIARSRRRIARRTSGVCAECFRITALPAMIAGTTLFTAMR